SAPVRILISVDLPAPFSPSSACTSPARTSNETLRRAWTPENDLLIARASRRGVTPVDGPEVSDTIRRVVRSVRLKPDRDGPPEGGHYVRSSRLPYHANRNPNCVFRPSSAVVMVPTVALEMLASGLPKLSWLNRLNTSARNSSRARPPIGNRLLTEKFTCCVPGPRTVLRPAVPCVPLAGTAYAVASNQRVGDGSSSSPRLPALTTLTRCGMNEPHWQTLVDVTENGNPLPSRTIPCTCQPPRM